MSTKKYLIPFFLFLSLLFNGLVIGTMIGSLFVPKGSGLAGPAIALGYGVFGTGAALVLGIIILKKSNHAWVKKWTIISGILAILLFVFLFIRYQLKNNPSESNEVYGMLYKQRKQTIAVENRTFQKNENILDPSTELMGMGIVKPKLIANTALYFYSPLAIENLPGTDQIIDSLTFAEKNYTIDIATAPPWFVPEYMKMDYQILHLKVRSVNRFWAEVIGNKLTNQSVWVDREAIELYYWPDFLLNVFSVEPINHFENPLRLKPLENSSLVIHESPMGYSVVSVQGDWLQVSTIDENMNATPKYGWIKWKDGETWLIKYNLLS